MPSHLHQRLRAARENAGITQAAIAALCDVRRGAVSLWESVNDNRRTVPSLAQLKIVANLTGVPLYWLIDDESVIPGEWREIACNDPNAEAAAPAWAKLSPKHELLAKTLDNAAKANAFPAEVAGGMADILDGMIKASGPKQ